MSQAFTLIQKTTLIKLVVFRGICMEKDFENKMRGTV
jgi:hypothetical protein